MASETLEFQIIDWNNYHEKNEECEDQYVIQLFGRTEDDKDVCLKVTDFKPHFYVEIPDNWRKNDVDDFVYAIKNKVKWMTEKNASYDYDLSKSLHDYRLVKKHKFYGFTNKRKYQFIWLIFKSHVAFREFSKILEKPLTVRGKQMSFQRYETNIEPHIRFMHIQNLSSCGWVCIDKNKLDENREYSNCDLSYNVNWRHVLPSKSDDRIAPLKIMGYDIECISCDHNFPQAIRESDKIIQIGITMYRYGSLHCYEQHILTLGGCAPIKGANVECYRTEENLIRGFARKIRDIRPDFKAGYNNFGFDDQYIFDRIKRIDSETAKRKNVSVESLTNSLMEEILNTMGKLNNKYIMETEKVRKSLSTFEEKNLSSSALGDNIFRYFNVPGTISVDMLKVIMRDHKLSGYKLDFVSANFITEDVKKIDYCNNNENSSQDETIKEIWIHTKSTKALDKGAYIQFMVDDGYSSTPLCDGAKYRVLDIQSIKEDDMMLQGIRTAVDQRTLDELGSVLSNKLIKTFWTFAKDDMHHTLINKYFREEDPIKIRQVAKYCLKDCKLVNLLMAKLEIIVNSIGMAKVCHVPLSYLFFRGQGVKIFSLVSKQCRNRNYLIPVLKRKQIDVDGNDDEETYEGATVIIPTPGVYLDPIAVLDYNSLYPNSMRERNTTHECYVNDPIYDNLSGYVYHDIYIIRKDKDGKIIRNIDGTPIKDHHRFAQELVSDKIINEEMKPIFDKINEDLDNNIKKIMAKTNFTQEDKDEMVKEISDNYQTIKTNTTNEYELAQKMTKEELDRKLSQIDDELKENIERIKKISQITDTDRNRLVEKEKKLALKKISDEKAKKYNTVNGMTVRYGILPEILTELLNSRKVVNARLAVEKDPAVKPILNSLQLAYKITANSLYGQTGAKTSPLYFIAIAASTTAIGRERLYYAKKVVEEKFEGSEVIYGDSVTGDTPIVVKDEYDDIHIKYISDLGTEWYSYRNFKLGENGISEKSQSKCKYMIWTANGWANIARVIRHKTMKRIYRVKTSYGCVDVTEDHSLLDSDGNLIKPIECNNDTRLLHGWMSGYKAPSELIINNIKSLSLNDKLSIQKTYFAMKHVGHDVIIRYNGDDVELSTDAPSYNVIDVKYLRNTSPDEYVYDIETTDGTFHAGIGELIVKNTDSIFINFHLKNPDGSKCSDEVALRKTIRMAKQAGNIINGSVPKPQFIAYEKTLFPFVLVAKKKYVGLLYGEDPKKYYLKAMGIVLKRRDNAPIVKIVVGGIIDYILKHRDINGAIKYTKDTLHKLMNGEYPIEKFIISKTLKANYKNPSTIAHKVLADRMAIRDPGNKPQINDRIPFVYVIQDLGKKKIKDILQGDLIEHHDFVIQNKLRIDYLYYLEHQIVNPAAQILKLMISTRRVEKLFESFIIEERRKRSGCMSMEKWIGDLSDGDNVSNTYDTMIRINDDKIKAITGKGNKLDKKSMELWMPNDDNVEPVLPVKNNATKKRTIVDKDKPKTQYRPLEMDKWMNEEDNVSISEDDFVVGLSV